MSGPPEKRSGPFTSAKGNGPETLLRLAEGYHGSGWKQWQREARRLAGEYVTTGREATRLAFERHVGGMLVQLREMAR